MAPSIYLINPRADFPNYHGAEVCRHLGLASISWIADLAVATVAALIPDDFEISICDDYLNDVNFDSTADFIGLTGKTSQAGRMIELATEFRKRGKTVMIGGPFASLSPSTVRPHCDILVKGEIEEIAPQLFTDLRAGTWKDEYVGNQPDLRTSPIPRWDLYPNNSALCGCVQTSRGCPFTCEFCDVIQYAGRRQRHKPIEQVLAELDRLYACGYSNVFLADDNFTVYRRHARELLKALRDWNHRQPEGAVRFSTQLSIDTAREDDILQLCAEAGLHRVFIGIETPNEDSLREMRKRQNVGIDLVQQIRRFLDYGVSVIGGMMVGFDSDGPDIFERQLQFAMLNPVPIFTVRALVAPEATPLYARMKEARRLVTEEHLHTYSGNGPWQTNIIHKQMDHETFLNGLRWLGNSLYHPRAFGQRMLQFIDAFRPCPTAMTNFRKQDRAVDRKILPTILAVRRLGKEESNMVSEILEATADRPAVNWLVLAMLFEYRQIRYMYEFGHFWEPQLASEPAPPHHSHDALISLTS